MTDKKSKHRLLMSLLAPLLRKWGYEAVRQCLDDAHAEQVREVPALATHTHRLVKESRRTSAPEMVDRLDYEEVRKEPLRVLASRFDDKTFLPTASDVRYFLEMRGLDARSIKKRQGSFRKVLKALLNMADDELRLLQESGSHAGPTRLGPLSDAIKATSAAVRVDEPQAESEGGTNERQVGQAPVS